MELELKFMEVNYKIIESQINHKKYRLYNNIKMIF